MKKFVADGVFHAKLYESFGRILRDYVYGGMEVKYLGAWISITIGVIMKEGAKDLQTTYNELTSLIQKRYGFEDNQL